MTSNVDEVVTSYKRLARSTPQAGQPAVAAARTGAASAAGGLVTSTSFRRLVVLMRMPCAKERSALRDPGGVVRSARAPKAIDTVERWARTPRSPPRADRDRAAA